jgi:hypothetical protein
VLIFPDSDFLANTYDFMALDAEQDKKYQTQFQQVVGA